MRHVPRPERLSRLERYFTTRMKMRHAAETLGVDRFLAETSRNEARPDDIYRTPRWKVLRPHEKQWLFLLSDRRFNISPSGRRSGKCVAAGTMISMADGTFKAVELVQPGELVLSVGPQYQIEPKPVSHVHDNGDKAVVRINAGELSLWCTQNHPLMYLGGSRGIVWTEAERLNPGDSVAVQSTGGALGATFGLIVSRRIDRIELLGCAPTYDLTVEHNHNFIANGFVTHNTECAKRRLVRKAVQGQYYEDTQFVAAAPTHDQSKKIFWRDLKRMVPSQFVKGKPKEAERTIELTNGARIVVVGMDVPERVEGSPIAHVLMDEYADMKESAWVEHMRPALADTQGTADFIGVPSGRNHYHELYLNAKDDDTGEWGVWHWPSKDVLPESEIEAMRRTMDPRTFRQETEGTFESFYGMAYYGWNSEKNCRPLHYDRKADLIFCFDFNVSPGCAVVVQEFEAEIDPYTGLETCPEYTGVLDEVWIRQSSNTPMVCQQLIAKYGDHPGEVLCYGDPSGGQRHTSSTEGTDWDLIYRIMAKHYEGRVQCRFRRRTPPVRDRLNAMNSRICSEEGRICLRADPRRAKLTIRDLEGVGSTDDGDIDKSDKWLSHLSDGLGYFVEYEHSIRKDYVEAQPI